MLSDILQLVASEETMIATGTCFMKGNEAEQDSGNSVRGTVTFEWDDTEEVFVKGTIEGLKPGKHGLYVCALGNITNGCISSGTHYNPCDKKHGGPEDPDRHVGDLGNIEANDDGVATFEMHDRLLRLAGNYSVIGRTLVRLCGIPPIFDFFCTRVFCSYPNARLMDPRGPQKSGLLPLFSRMCKPCHLLSPAYPVVVVTTDVLYCIYGFYGKAPVLQVWG
ncbi:superoxide dismutase [Cu-Zn]-like isoform X3 [Scyliorhinus canicula]|uniref:superoxide dismutase [Cu-Zn]-like isoform X3 n=1 Tax=Scyliorhinus canicula TaxID=7830 RepID=UPI0018F537E6|nr:superoxide dismutase [Cu-Zn]-like isoform X3 [Scyliorhinus canicula]